MAVAHGKPLRSSATGCHSWITPIQLPGSPVSLWPWIESHPRVALRWFPTDCPQANPIERVFGDAHDPCTRNHQRKRLRHVVSDVERHLDQNGPWLDKRSPLYGTPE